LCSTGARTISRNAVLTFSYQCALSLQLWPACTQYGRPWWRPTALCWPEQAAPPQPRGSRMPPDSGLESAAGGAHAAKRPWLRRCSAAFSWPLPIAASERLQGTVLARASNSGGDYVKPLLGPNTFLTVGSITDDDGGAADWRGSAVAISGAVAGSSASFWEGTVSTRWLVEKHKIQSCRCQAPPCRPVKACWTVKVAAKDDVAGRNLDTWQAESAYGRIASVVARNHAQYLVTFWLFNSYRTGVSPIRCTKRWDGADLTPYHRIMVSDQHHPNTWCGSCTLNLTAGHPSAPLFGVAP